MNLSKNFTLIEFTKSQTALRMGIDNTPNDEHLSNAKKLFENVVQAVKAKQLILKFQVFQIMKLQNTSETI